MSVINKFAQKVVQRAKLNLGMTQSRYGVKSTWKNKRPSAFKKHQFKSRIVATGRLKNSIAFKVKKNSILFSMADYGIFVEEGRRGKKDVFGIGKKDNRAAPVKKIRKWVDVRGLQPRDEKGRFLKKTKTRMNSLAYLINRKIKWFGIAPSGFMEKAFTQTLKEYEDELPSAIIAKLFK